MQFSACRLAIPALLSCVLYTQNNIPAQAPPTIDQALSAKGIPLTHDGLMQALSDPRPEVRSLAAGALAQRKEKDAIPAIKSALSSSSNTLERQNLARALIWLDDPAGLQATRAICQDSSIRDDDRMIAAADVAETSDSGCSSAVLGILASTDNPSVSRGAMEYLMHQSFLHKSLYEKAIYALAKALHDDIPYNRSLAGKCLAKLRIVEGRTHLRIALEREQDANTRNDMQGSLKELNEIASHTKTVR